MKIYAYKNPFNLKEEKFWDEISKHPNLCVSQTLVMGLTNEGSDKKYARKDYNYIYTIDSLIKEVYEAWIDNPHNSIKQFVSCSKEIDKIKDLNLRKSFKFNKRSVFDALRMLIELEIKPDEIPDGRDMALNQFKIIYSNLIEGEEAWKALEDIEVDERLIKFSLDRLMKKEIDDMPKGGKFDNWKAELETIRDLVSKNYQKVEKIIIHGVHKFTPMIIRLINDLKNEGIEIVFVINYIPEFEKVYETWREVYKWTGLDFHVGEGEVYRWGNLGESIALLLEGKISEFKKHEVEFIKFDNLSSFCDYVSDVYMEVSDLESKTKRTRIAKMRQQFYATNMEEINNLLKQYHPEQFGNKHFLAYPIGQFILSIYNMWDQEKQSLKIESGLLKECLSVGFFQQEGKPNPIEIYNKLEAYYENLKIEDNYLVTELLDRLKILKNVILKMEVKEKEEGKESLLRRFSMYQLKVEDIEYFIDVINSLIKVGEKLFANGEKNINFIKHYSNLLEILTEEDLGIADLSFEEKKMLDEIKLRIQEIKDVDIEGSIDDLKESLHFYLNRVDYQEDQDNQASWIVRNFEQLDGGVLLKDATKTNRTYHLAMVGDLNMNFKVKELFPWPLSEEFFLSTKLNNPNYLATLVSYREYKNFLRYSLFYAIYFLDREIKISYIENHHDEKNHPYYILKLLGLEAVPYREEINRLYNKNNLKKMQYKIYPSIEYDPTVDEIRNFLFCEYKYLLDEILDGGTFFEDSYLQNLFYQTMLLVLSWRDLQGKGIEYIDRFVRKNNKKYKRHLILWNKINFIDAENKVIKELKKSAIINGRVRNVDKKYIETRRKFIYAKIKGFDNNSIKNLIKDVLLAEKNPLIVNKIFDYINYPGRIQKNQNVEKCQFCNQNQICLQRYKGEE